MPLPQLPVAGSWLWNGLVSHSRWGIVRAFPGGPGRRGEGLKLGLWVPGGDPPVLFLWDSSPPSSTCQRQCGGLPLC